jgi:hypothetical protein
MCVGEGAMNFVSWQKDNLWDRFTTLAVDAIAVDIQVSTSKQLHLHEDRSFYI